jgi:hypothetical protein
MVRGKGDIMLGVFVSKVVLSEGKVCYAAEATHNDWDMEEEVMTPLRAFLNS